MQSVKSICCIKADQIVLVMQTFFMGKGAVKQIMSQGGVKKSKVLFFGKLTTNYI